jgi:hypothetical protein
LLPDARNRPPDGTSITSPGAPDGRFSRCPTRVRRIRSPLRTLSPLAATIFAGDRRVWRWAALTGIPLIGLLVAWCAIPRPFYTGTDSVNDITISTPIKPSTRACIDGLQIPAGTQYLELALASGQNHGPLVHAALRTPQGTAHTLLIGPPFIGAAVHVSLRVPRLPAGASSEPARLCLRSSRGTFGLGATPVIDVPAGHLQARGANPDDNISVWYLPAAGAKRSYFGELTTMADRAARFAPGYVVPWLFWVVFFGVLPLIGLLAVRLLALAVAGETSIRRLALWLFVIGALNGASWAVITPAFQSPDEVDHYAYTESLVTRGEKPSPYAQAANRWSSAEAGALVASGFLTDHEISDSRAAGLPANVTAYRRRIAHGSSSRSDGGGYQTTSSYGPLYYYAVAPGYLLGGTPFSRLGGMRLVSALIAALVGVFTLLAMRELAPRRLGLAVLAGLVVELEPLYGFLSGAVNNDIGIDVGGAAVAYLLLRLVRRGLPPLLIVALGVLLGALPWVKSSAYELWVMTILGLLAALWRHRRRVRARLVAGRTGLSELTPTLGAGAGAIVAFGIVYLLCRHLNTTLTPGPPVAGAVNAAATSTTGAATGPVKAALENPGTFLVYLWEALFPRLSSMTPHFPAIGSVGELIFIRRGWGGFGWYDTFFPWWVYRTIEIAMACALALGLRGLWQRRRAIAGEWPQVAILALFPIVVFVGFETAFWTSTSRAVVAEMGRYEFPALAALGALGAGALLGVPRRIRLPVLAGVLSAFLALSVAAHALTFVAFFS